jgi:hypothetical protein
MIAPFLQSLPESECQELLNGLYASWFVIVHTALCCSIPVKSVGPHSRSWWEPGLQVLLDQRSAAYSALVAYTENFDQASLSLLPADPIWQDLWETYADLRRKTQSVIQSNKAVKWKNMLHKLQSDFENDKRHFFATIKTLKTSRLKSKPSSIISLTVH